MLRLADVLVTMRPKVVNISGGEPLLVKGLQEVAERLVAGGVPIHIYTSGYGVDEVSAAWIVRLFSLIHVSVDGADAATHDFIRGREGSFEEAMTALSLFDRLAGQRSERAGGQIRFGIDFTVIQSNFHQLEPMCSEVAPMFPHLWFLFLASAVPCGLANREGYAEHELLTDDQRAVLRDSELAAHLRALVPTVAKLELLDGIGPPMEPSQISLTNAFRKTMHIEPNGEVRGISQYEGTVGNILEQPPEVIWRRAQERYEDAFVVRELSAVRTMKDWATAARNIDRRFASSAELLRISRRKEYPGEAHRKDP